LQPSLIGAKIVASAIILNSRPGASAGKLQKVHHRPNAQKLNLRIN